MLDKDGPTSRANEFFTSLRFNFRWFGPLIALPLNSFDTRSLISLTSFYSWSGTLKLPTCLYTCDTDTKLLGTVKLLGGGKK